MAISDRRSCLRYKVNGPIFASFDGVTGGVILDLSERGLSMQTAVPLQADLRVRLRLERPDSDNSMETTGYIAWADALGRAGVRFSELPAEARQRLDEWLASNATAPSRKAPKLTVSQTREPSFLSKLLGWENSGPRSIRLEAGADRHGSGKYSSGKHGSGEHGSGEHGSVKDGRPPVSTSIQYEFNALGPDLDTALQVISERARTLLRGTGAAIAIIDGGPMICRASAGIGGPPLGTQVEVNSGISGECVRTGKALRCDDAESDARIDAEICRRLGVRSIVAAPVRYQREVVGVLEVFSTQPSAFDDGDLAVLERLAQTVLLIMSHSQPFKRS